MIFQILLDGVNILDNESDDLKLIKANLNVGMNIAGTLTFTMPYEHKYYNKPTFIKSYVEVKEVDKSIFYGRVIKININWNREKEITCEGALAFLNDSVGEYNSYINTTSKEYIRKLFDRHNTLVESEKHFNIGRYTEKNKWITEITSTRDNTYDVLKSNINDFSPTGYYMARREGSKNYFDLLKEGYEEQGRSIKFGINLKDLKIIQSKPTSPTALVASCTMKVIYTVVDEDGNVIESKYDHDEDCTELVYNKEAIKKYGYIWEHVYFDSRGSNSEIMENLIVDAQEYIDKLEYEDTSYQFDAADLYYIEKTGIPIRLGQKITLISEPHNINLTATIKEIEYNILTGEKSITIGKAKNSIVNPKWNKDRTYYYGYLDPGYYDGDGKLIASYDKMIEDGFMTISGNVWTGQNYQLYGRGFIVFPDEITTVEVNTRFANYGSNQFDYINVPDTITTIGEEAFASCINAEYIRVGDSVTTIGRAAFRGGVNAKSIYVSDSVTDIGISAFAISGGSKCTSLYIGSSVRNIGNYAFGGIGNMAYGLDEVVVPESARNVGYQAFASTVAKVYDIQGPPTLQTLSFMGIIPKEELRIGEKVTAIQNYTFMGANLKSVTTIYIGDNVKTIGNNIFADSICSNLVDFHISNSVETIADDCFSTFPTLTTVDLRNSTNLKKIGNRCFSYYFYDSSLTSVHFPDSLLDIGNGCFNSFTQISTIEFGNNLNYIGSRCFNKANGVTNLDFPNSLTYIGDMSFYDVGGAQTINIGPNVTYVGSESFFECPNADVRCPSSATVGSGAFYSAKSITYY